MKIWLAALVVITLHGAESFITKEEYAAQLYHSPRGIGCHLCHGEKGEGKLIASYKEKNEEKSFFGPSIRDVPFERFTKVLNSRKRGMPRYFLTSGEIRALYYYLQMHKEKAENGSDQD